MAGRLGSGVLNCLNSMYTMVAGSFTTVNGSDPTIRSGTGFTVTRAAEGRFAVTITNSAEIVSVIVGHARETLPGSNLAEHVEVVVDQDTITNDDFEVQAYLLDDISGASEPALDDQPGAEIHFIAIVAQAL